MQSADAQTHTCAASHLEKPVNDTIGQFGHGKRRHTATQLSCASRLDSHLIGGFHLGSGRLLSSPPLVSRGVDTLPPRAKTRLMSLSRLVNDALLRSRRLPEKHERSSPGCDSPSRQPESGLFKEKGRLPLSPLWVDVTCWTNTTQIYKVYCNVLNKTLFSNYLSLCVCMYVYI